MLKLKAQKDGAPLPEAFQNKGFRSFVDMANYADKHNLPDGNYWCYNDKGTNLLTSLREVKRKGSGFWVEGRGNI